MQETRCTKGFRQMGVGRSLVHLMDFKFIGGPEKSTVGSIPIYSRHQGAGSENAPPAP